jgi:isopentenyl diphosphate isomerase/L-lactate dehydrogenase-like FMN-dependent dehydrogenase
MNLDEIYTRGQAFFRDKAYGRTLDYVETGFIKAHDRRVIDRYTFRPRCVDAGEATTAVSFLGIDLQTPVIMSAMTMPIPAMGENAMGDLARALKDCGSLLWTGTPIPKDLETLVDVGVPVAANVKPLRDRAKLQAEIEFLLACNVTWLGIELDAGQGTKVGDQEMPFDCTPFAASEIAAIKKGLPIPLVVKGVLSATDARQCVDAGADAIVVSNHGGHTLDYLPHPFQVMDEIREAVGDEIGIIVDGGFRRGSDVLKGLAFGAGLVGLGRPILLGLAAGGREGVVDLITALTRELKRLMTMVGAAHPGDVRRDCLIADE